MNDLDEIIKNLLLQNFKVFESYVPDNGGFVYQVTAIQECVDGCRVSITRNVTQEGLRYPNTQVVGLIREESFRRISQEFIEKNV